MTANCDMAIALAIIAAHRAVVYSVDAQCAYCRYFRLCGLVDWRTVYESNIKTAAPGS